MSHGDCQENVKGWCQGLSTMRQWRRYLSWMHWQLVQLLRIVGSLLRFTHSSSSPNERANHPMHWTRHTILYLSSGYRRENNESLTQVKKAMWLNQNFYSIGLHLNLPFHCGEKSCLYLSLPLALSNIHYVLPYHHTKNYYYDVKLTITWQEFSILWIMSHFDYFKQRSFDSECECA